MPLSDGNLHERYRRYTSLRCITSYIMQNSVRDLLARRRTAKVTYSTAKKFSELDGARNCVAGNDHVSRSDNQENNCAMSRITVTLRAASSQSLKEELHSFITSVWKIYTVVKMHLYTKIIIIKLVVYSTHLSIFWIQQIIEKIIKEQSKLKNNKYYIVTNIILPINPLSMVEENTPSMTDRIF